MNRVTEDKVDGDEAEAIEQTPDQHLAARISDELLARGFANEDKKNSLVTKIATGQMHAEDWRVLAASTLRESEEPERDEDDAANGEEGSQS